MELGLALPKPPRWGGEAKEELGLDRAPAAPERAVELWLVGLGPKEEKRAGRSPEFVWLENGRRMVEVVMGIGPNGGGLERGGRTKRCSGPSPPDSE